MSKSVSGYFKNKKCLKKFRLPLSWRGLNETATQISFLQIPLPIVVIEFDALCELDFDLVSVLVPDGHAPTLRDVPLATADNLKKYYMYNVYYVCIISTDV